jgi:cytochrome c oxidase assembly factor CtaG
MARLFPPVAAISSTHLILSTPLKADIGKGRTMSNWAPILHIWDLEPSIIIGCAGLLLADLAALRWRLSRMRAAFTVGVLILAATLMSPLDALGDYLFSAHMFQHLLLILIVPPLLIIGLPVEPMRRFLRFAWAARLERFLSWPLVAWLIGIGTLAAWHLPGLYNAALASESVHVVEHLAFLVSATIFWWPVFAPLPECRMDLTAALVYLLTATFANGLIGALLMAVPPALYPAYLHPEDPLHILDSLMAVWPLTAAEDKRVGAVSMIIGGGIAFMYGAVYMLWLHRDDVPSTG